MTRREKPPYGYQFVKWCLEEHLYKKYNEGASRILISRVGVLRPIRTLASRIIENPTIRPENPTICYPFSPPATLYFPKCENYGPITAYIRAGYICVISKERGVVRSLTVPPIDMSESYTRNSPIPLAIWQNPDSTF